MCVYTYFRDISVIFFPILQVLFPPISFLCGPFSIGLLFGLYIFINISRHSLALKPIMAIGTHPRLLLLPLLNKLLTGFVQLPAIKPSGDSVSSLSSQALRNLPLL